MLKLMRDSFQHLKWVLILVVVVFVLFVFAEWGASGLTGGGGASAGFAARVEGEPISVVDYNRALAMTEQRYEEIYQQPITPEMRAQLGLERQVLNSLVDQKLLMHEARRLGLEPTAAELRMRILEIPVLNPDGNFVGEELYARFVTANLGYPNTSAFERDLARDLTVSKLDSAFFNSVAIPAPLVEQEYRRRNETARIRYVLVPAGRFVSSVEVTPAEVEQYYRANTNRYSHQEQRKIDYLLADVSRIRSQIQPTPAEIRQRYDSTPGEYSTPEQVRASHILLSVPEGATPAEAAAVEQRARDLVAQLRAGGDFGALAQQHSADPGSAANGGDLGFFGRGAMVGEFEDAAFSQEIGEIGDPVRTQFGYHIIRITEKREAGAQPFEEVQDTLRQQIITERAETQARDRLAQIRARLEQQRPLTPANLTSAADNFVSHNTTPFFNRAGAIEGLGPAVEVTNWAFGAQQGDLGPVIQTSQGPIVPYLRETRPAGVSPLEEIRPRVESEARNEKAVQQAAQAIQRASAGGAGPEAVASSLGLSTSEATLTRDGRLSGVSGDVSQIVDAAFAANQGEVKGPFPTEDGAILFQLEEQQKFDPAKFAEERPQIEESMRRSEAMRLRSSLLDRLRRDAEVEINEDLLGPAPAAAPQPLG